MTNQYLIGGGRSPMKIMSLGELDLLMDAQVSLQTPNGALLNAYQKAPWFFRAINLSAEAIAALPFDLLKGNTVVDSSDDWQNICGFMPKPKHLLRLIEASLFLLGYAYLFPVKNRIKWFDLKYCNPTSITPKITTAEGLVSFRRQLGASTLTLAPDELVYFWNYDPFVELGHPLVSRGKASLQAAGVLVNLTDFASGFFTRGAIKAMLLTVEGNPPPGEKDKLKEWWQRMFTGIRRAWQTEVVNAAIKPVVVGEGVKELENTTLTATMREDIATGAGIPHSILFSNAANYATAGQDELHWLEKTVVPESEFIAEVLNEQVFLPQGYHIVFKPKSMEAYQAHENQRADALLKLTQSKIPLGVAMEMLEFVLPEGYEYDDFNNTPAPTPVQLPASAQVTDAQPANLQPAKRLALEAHNPTEAEQERAQFLRFAKKHAGNADRLQAFKFMYLSEAEAQALRQEAQGSETPMPFQSYRERYAEISRGVTEPGS